MVRSNSYSSLKQNGVDLTSDDECIATDGVSIKEETQECFHYLNVRECILHKAMNQKFILNKA